MQSDSVWAGVLDWIILRGHFQNTWFCDSIVLEAHDVSADPVLYFLRSLWIDTLPFILLAPPPSLVPLKAFPAVALLSLFSSLIKTLIKQASLLTPAYSACQWLSSGHCTIANILCKQGSNRFSAYLNIHQFIQPLQMSSASLLDSVISVI